MKKIRIIKETIFRVNQLRINGHVWGHDTLYEHKHGVHKSTFTKQQINAAWSRALAE